jgi:hypothetical protein
VANSSGVLSKGKEKVDYKKTLPKKKGFFEKSQKKVVSSRAECCAKSHKDRVVIVPHDLICMIHGLVLTSNLQDELVCTSSCT